MRNRKKYRSSRMAALLTVVVLLGCFPRTASAETAEVAEVFSLNSEVSEAVNPRVLYDAAENRFSFENYAVYTDTKNQEHVDLFTAFREQPLMPGSERTQKIDLEVKNASGKYVFIYLKAMPVEWLDETGEAKEEMLKKLHFSVSANRLQLCQSEDTEGKGMLLGVFSDACPRQTDIGVTLSLDADAGNEFQSLPGVMEWIFSAEMHTSSEGGDSSDSKKMSIEETTASEDPALNREQHDAYLIGYEDGTIRPKNPITRAETATIFFRLMTDASREKYWSFANHYTDVTAKDWYNNAISTLENADVIRGYGDGSFHPDGSITRAEFVALAVRFDSSEFEIGEAFFSDLTNHWAEADINRAAGLGYLCGYGDGTFRPEAYITRAEAAVMMNRILGRAPEKAGFLREEMQCWPDNPEESWYYEDLQEATNSHDYEMLARSAVDGQAAEVWKNLREERNWKLLEMECSLKALWKRPVKTFRDVVYDCFFIRYEKGRSSVAGDNSCGILWTGEVGRTAWAA